MIRHTTTYPAVTRRPLSFNLFRRKDKCCDQEEGPREPPPKYIVQKSCGPSIFEAWKPKIPDLNDCHYPSIQTNMMMPYKHKTCMAGMKFRDATRCEIEARARECQKINHPKWLRHCPPTPKEEFLKQPACLHKAAQIKCKGVRGKTEKIMVVAKSMRRKCDPVIPESDWNPDGHLD